jgi:hypothetical protein
MASKAQEQEKQFPLPRGYEDRSVGFARAFEHAKKNGNNDKASLVYAEAWAHDFEDVGDA